MVAHDIAHRQAHVFCIHIGKVAFQPRLIADIACVNQKSGLLLRGKFLNVVYPFAHAVFPDLRV